MSDSTPEPSVESMACTICHGKKEEHGPGSGVRHAFTLTSGELVTHEQQAQQQARQLGPQVVRLGGAQTNEAQAMNRLLEILLQKGVVTAEEALYVATGMKTRKFSDPAMPFSTGGNG